ncbi:Spermine oxidase [Frankliniella fusca]|uniref:Spermine oxidase n=1 Tax=Frankliniella fusca TaxID=407009 RepID=A0AAE1LDS8_9NEOP|nr:Spermine oxidase [Frankliniella fusca]
MRIRAVRAPSNHSRILIIGAGAAGYAAASRLMENNVFDVTILEAEPRIGGRVNTVRFAENIVDLGAEWVHGEVGNVVYEMAEPLELLDHTNRYLTPTPAFVWSGGAVADPDDIELMFNLTEEIRDAGKEGQLANYTGSYGEWFLEQFSQRLLTVERRPPAELVDRFLGWFEKETGFYDGSDTWFSTSGRGITVYKECDGNLALAWKRNGYRSVFDLLTKRFPNPAQELPVRRRVLLNHEVSAIRWGERVYSSWRPSQEDNEVHSAQRHNEVTEAADEDMMYTTEDAGAVTETATEATEAGEALQSDQGRAASPPVVVELTGGGRYTADIVLVTVSLGVLKHSAQALFDPPLPERKMNAVQNLGFGQVNKLFMYFSEPWWPSGLSGYSVLVTGEDLEEFKRKYPVYGKQGHWVHGLSGFYIDEHRPNVVLMDWIVGEPARVMELYSDYQIMMGCKKWLEMFLGQNYSIPVPIGFTRSKWWSNPHFKGSYSFRSLDSDRADAWAAHLAEPILDVHGEPAVLFAGEATHDYYYSTVHGAIETGWREADRILK